MALGRRAFLQRLGGVLSVLGLIDQGLMGQTRTYQEALAKPANRRLALLIGINTYPESAWQGGTGNGKGLFLKGCKTDVALQRALLIHQFGFAPEDIVTLVNGEATHAEILKALDQHLISQAQPGDTVLFHFSGLGSTVQLSEYPNQVFSTLVPVDGVLPKASSPMVRDLFESVLAERLSQVRTTQVVTVIDASSATQGLPLRGNCRVRSRPWAPTGELPPRPADGVENKSDPLAVVRTGRSPNWPGVVLRASTPDTPALESDWDGFSAGLFTYALTQTLWTAPSSSSNAAVLRRLNTRAERWVGQGAIPAILGNGSASPDKMLYGVDHHQPDAVDGVVLSVSPGGQSVRVWLGGMDAKVLAHSSALWLCPTMPAHRAPSSPMALLVQNRMGLTAQVQVAAGTTPVEVGDGMVEVMRSLGRDIPLHVALDQGLKRIERVDATSALAGMPDIATAIAGEQMADCVFGQPLAESAPTLTATAITSGDGAALEAPAPADGQSQVGYGLFSPNQTPLPGTIKDKGEAVKTAVGRLGDRLQSLLAVKLLRLTRNPTSSALPVRLTTESAESAKQILGGEETSSARRYRRQATPPEEIAPVMGSPDQGIRHLRFRIQNLGRRSLYSIALALDHRGNLSIYCPNVAELPSQETSAETTVATVQLVPEAQQALPAGDTGWLLKPLDESLEIFTVFGITPFRHTWAALQAQGGVFQRDRFIPIRTPLPIVQAVLMDLDAASTEAREAIAVESNPATFQLCSSAWATLSVRTS
ncbi:MAG: caspase family protein [Cyanobacteria bacterium]|nr:caspase family protein [Cyanobacteriota bacterium]MDA0866529.1 caspase family protein [Cyanobacteriota bacterium]